MTAPQRSDRWTDLEVAHAAGLRRSGSMRPPSWAAAVGIGLFVAVVVAAWWFVLAEAQGQRGPLSAQTWTRAWEFLGQLLGVGNETTPAYLRAGPWRRVVALAGETVVMSVLGAGLAGIGALLTVAFSARTLTRGHLGSYGRGAGWAVFLVARGSHTLARAVPDLVWGLLIVLVLRPGVLAGALALAIHNYGVLGRLGADVVEDVDPQPVHNLQASGAGTLQTLLYGIVPQVLPQFLTFLLYRWEVIIRATAVVGLVTSAGLGYQLLLDFGSRSFTDLALVMVAYVLLVWAVDLASTGLRRLAR